MLASQSPVEKSIVLVGAGNAHLTFLRRWGMSPIPGVSLTFVSESAVSLYSAMIPAYLSGNASREQIEIDVGRAAAAWGVRFVPARVLGIERTGRVRLEAHPSIRYDVLSLNVGSRPAMPDGAEGSDLVLPIRPLSRFLEEIENLRDGHRRLVVVGGGATGSELALALARDSRAKILVVEGAARCEFEKELLAGQVELITGTRVIGVEPGGVRLSSRASVACDKVIFATEAAASPLLRELGLEKDARGFIRVTDTLQTLSDPRIFASGDCASLDSHPDLPKNGVYAVQQGRRLWENIRHFVRGEEPERYQPSRHVLSIVDTADGSAVFRYGRIRLRSPWALRLKRHIDRGWRESFLPQPMPETSLPPRCGGCGSKLPSHALARVLARLEIPEHPDVVLGCKAGEDASVARPPQGMVEVQTVDFFRSFVNDPYLFGRLAAIHAVSDLHAMNARPSTALAIVTLPQARPAIQETLLEDMLRGALESFRALGVTLTGGHTAEGLELALGFSVTGYAEESRLFRKNRLLEGDRLVLTKRLGTGALFAARMRGRCRSDWFDRMTDELVRPNDRAAVIFERHGVVAGTDITGFGLAGHLLEMLDASSVSARLWFTEVKLYDGFKDVTSDGILSSLHADNARIVDRIEGREIPEWLFDPQTCGGLLGGVSADRADQVVMELRDAGYPDAAIVGEVLRAESEPRVYLN